MAALAIAKLLNPGRTLTIDKEISRGVCAMVYEGKLNGKRVAVKKMPPLMLDYGTSQGIGIREISQSLLQCALLLKQLSHPHIVEFIEFYDSKDGDHVLVMERLDCNLQDYLERHTGKLSRERQIDICLQIADAVHYLHSQEPPVVYRDLSAGNVLLSPDGVLKLGSCQSADRMPSCGYFDVQDPGTVIYSPPEALVGNAHYNEKIDIFSFGVLMLEIATQCSPSLKLPGRGTVPEIDRRAEDLSLLPEDHPLKPIILQCLRDDPGERPDSGAVLRMLSEGETVA